MSVLAIDPGTKCGFAADFSGTIRSGVWVLSREHRWLELWGHLESIHEIEKVKTVAIEDVQSHGRGDEKQVDCPSCHRKFGVHVQMQNTIAAHVYGGLVAIISMWCEWRGARLESVPVGTLKKFATGKGNAIKADMVAWAQMRWRDQNVKSDDQADALHILDWVLVEVLGRRKKQVIDVSRMQPELTEVDF